MVVDFNPCSAGTRSCVRPSHRDLHLLPDWVLMVVDFTVVRDPAARGWITICLIVPCAWRSFRS
jgi:hypothetical protein